MACLAVAPIRSRPARLLGLIALALAVGTYGGQASQGSNDPPLSSGVHDWHSILCEMTSLGIRKPQARLLGLSNESCEAQSETWEGYQIEAQRLTSDQFGFRLDLIHRAGSPGLDFSQEDDARRKILLGMLRDWSTVIQYRGHSELSWQRTKSDSGWRLDYFAISRDPTLSFQCVGLYSVRISDGSDGTAREQYVGYYCALSQFPLTDDDLRNILSGLRI